MSISWWLLERYHLGEATAEEAERVREAVQKDPVVAARLAEIQKASPAVSERAPRTLPRLETRWGRGLAAAVLVLGLSMLLASQLGRLGKEQGETGMYGVKGETLVLSVVRQHRGELSADQTTLALGDSYQLQVTCIPPRRASLSVTLLQDGVESKPLGERSEVDCSNDAPLGQPLVFDSLSAATLCVVEPGARQKSCLNLEK